MRRGVAVVTGASSGFGLLCCVELARYGFDVFATMRDLDRAGPLKEALSTAGLSAEILALDVCDPGSVATALERILERAGAVDVLVNNAGILVAGILEELDDDDLRRQFDTNVLGVLRVSRAVLPVMRERMHGRIINISSIGALAPEPGFGAYHASKAAMEAMSVSLRRELQPFNIHVCLVQPGLFPTPLLDRDLRVASERDSSPYAALSGRIDRAFASARRLVADADPATVARTVARLAVARSPRARTPVGVDAWFTAMLQSALPASVLDRLVEQRLELFGR